ncbi:MAG: pyridoxamine 5'-phosphate oxidase family protein [Acidobacteria bacterium]|nr:pyridoxamine 5'-phosphate oxidase family protein [Acidobacteriota bacterium]
MITNERAIPVINLLNREKNGVLSTLSKKMGGWPFGSLTPFAMTAEGDPMFLLSGLAEHTHNIMADPRVSLFCRIHQLWTIHRPELAPRFWEMPG